MALPLCRVKLIHILIHCSFLYFAEIEEKDVHVGRNGLSGKEK